MSPAAGIAPPRPRPASSSGCGVPLLVSACLVLSVAIAFASLLAAVAAEEAAAGVDEVGARFALADGALLKLKVRQLKEMLARKGATCEACVSKGDLVERIGEVREWADVVEQEEGKGEDDGLFREGETAKEREEQYRKLVESLKESSTAGGKRFTMMQPDGSMKEMDVEEFMRQTMKDNVNKEAGDSAGKTDL